MISMITMRSMISITNLTGSISNRRIVIMFLMKVSQMKNHKEMKLFIAIKGDGLVPIDCISYTIEEKALAAKVEEKDEWVIDNSCSYHMIGDKSKFVNMERYDCGIVRFGDDKAYVIHGRGSISFDGKHNTDYVLYV